MFFQWWSKSNGQFLFPPLLHLSSVKCVSCVICDLHYTVHCFPHLIPWISHNKILYFNFKMDMGLAGLKRGPPYQCPVSLQLIQSWFHTHTADFCHTANHKKYSSVLPVSQWERDTCCPPPPRLRWRLSRMHEVCTLISFIFTLHASKYAAYLPLPLFTYIHMPHHMVRLQSSAVWTGWGPTLKQSKLVGFFPLVGDEWRRLGSNGNRGVSFWIGSLT